jgi:acyl-CoA synthetase (AMP-forming)/AMP-acid ligase II
MDILLCGSYSRTARRFTPHALARLSRLHARDHPDAPFAIHGQEAITYGEAAAEANRLAHAFIDGGLRIGDRVAYLSRNSIHHALMYFAGSKAAVVPVPLNFRLLPSQWIELMNDAGAKV